jgi:type II secretory pathway pseudopilin PulG
VNSIRALTRTDWLKAIVVILASALVGLAFFMVLDGARARQDDVRRAQAQADQAIDSRQAATRRIDLLQAQLDGLEREIQTGQDERGRLATSVEALSEQVRQMGGRPVVTTSPHATPTSSRAPGARPAPSSGPRPTPRPTPRPSPSPRACVLGVCL